VSDDWLEDDPFADADDPAAREREQRRREREEKRRGKAPPPEPVAPPPPEPEPEAPREAAPEPAPVATPVATETAYHDEGDPEMAGAARNGRRPGDGDPRRPGFLGAIGRHPFRLFAVIAAIFVLWFLNALFQPFHGDGSGRVQVTIPKGSSVSEVGDLLSKKDVIDSSTLFQVRVTLAGKRSEIYSGHFTLARNMSYGAAIDALSQPPLKRTVTVTIPEGYSRPQAAQLVAEDGVPGSYTKATVRSKYLHPAKYGGRGAKDLEGFLFPDTFELKPNAPVADLVQLQLQDFKRRIEGVDMKYARSKNLTTYDVLIIASMVEREAGVSSQYRDVASVIYNRLHEGMPLGIDATIRFATGNYTKPLTESELAVDSPYNSRTNAGLPPGPIDSPGLEAIQAAAHPAKTGYLFYVTTPGACGKLTFAKTEAEFEAAVNKYNSAREAAGGNSPDSCGE
jgi:peptidoglycan lytic transglycosylase G